MKFKTKYKICKVKAYFDTGYGLTNYLKYAMAGYGLASGDVSTTLIIAGFYGVFCFILGYLWFRYGWIEAGIEVNNQHNKFVKEIRKRRKV